MKAAIPLIIIFALLLSACGASSSGQGEEISIPDYSKLDAESVSVVSPEEAGLEIVSMTDALPMGAQYIGFNNDESAFVYLYGDEVRQITINGKDDEFVLNLNLNADKDGLIEVFYEDGWVLWVKYDLGDMAGTWTLNVQNVDDDEARVLEAATDYKHAGSVSAPAYISYADGRIAYSGLHETDKGLERAVKLYDLADGSMKVIAESSIDSGVTYTSPAMGTEYVAYAELTEGEGYTIRGYVIPTGSTYEVATGAQVASVYASGFYLAAVIDESVAIFDPIDRVWRDVYNSASSIDLGGSSSSVWQVDISQVAVSGANMLIGGTNSLYSIDLNSLEAVELVPAGDETVTSVQLDGSLAIWRTFNRDTCDATYNYTVLDNAA